ncbi:phenoloxidase-activating factor 2-like [Athalia rosae]|uniref:phenoloxidase-activating factor 2-like n=1 Tax=Athalia rosae TaxID=37344 RepID=UPI002033DAA6|nr:phenoloxidase-activating factor 2-like [Athalia rosae]XP_048505310.1 phenoloxidase-activating factor 2-like [Athalia rosae]
MQCLGFLIALLGVVSGAPDREKRQVGTSLVGLQCQEIFGVACDSLNNPSPPPPLKTDLPTEAPSDCQCVTYYLCSSDKVVVTDGSFVIDKRVGETCPGILDVCCNKASIIPAPTDNATSSPPTDRPRPNQTPTPIPIPTPTPSPIPRPTVKPPAILPGCGHRNPGGVTIRIAGTDTESQFAEFPWMVAVLKKPLVPGGRSVYECGGSLIHPRVILTAAHTVEKKSVEELLVRAGEWDTQIRSEPIPHQERQVMAKILHENFNTNNLQNDFALLIVREAFIIAPNVNVLCLPQPTDIFDAARCTATGWGKNNFDQTGRFQSVLKKIELPVVPHEPCQTFLRLTRLGQPFVLDKTFICAGGEAGQDTCTGDGGSPLACPLANDPNRYVQAGIVAWGIGCGGDRQPGVYANVARARRWIDSKMAQYNLDTSSYTI